MQRSSLDPRLAHAQLAEYLLLGDRTHTDNEIDQWFQVQLAAWTLPRPSLIALRKLQPPGPSILRSLHPSRRYPEGAEWTSAAAEKAVTAGLLTVAS